jgi:hypothetical protein
MALAIYIYEFFIFFPISIVFTIQMTSRSCQVLFFFLSFFLFLFPLLIFKVSTIYRWLKIMSLYTYQYSSHNTVFLKSPLFTDDIKIMSFYTYQCFVTQSSIYTFLLEKKTWQPEFPHVCVHLVTYHDFSSWHSKREMTYILITFYRYFWRQGSHIHRSTYSASYVSEPSLLWIG